MTETLSEFYIGKTIFLTGAAGFLGTYMLEVLLRCFPGIVRIYVLLRSKNGFDPIQRREEIFKKKIFKETSKKHPELLEKVHVISGDISKPNLGMNENDMRKICDEVTIFFHGAASISFTQSYRSISLQNCKGTEYVIDICKKFKKLDILLYTSTAYSNCHIHPEKIEEKVYTLPYTAQTFLDEMENGTNESYDELVSSLETKWNLKWPNSYTFSKCVTENILLEKGADLPIVIVRPSIIYCAYKGILPGYVDIGTGVADLSVGVGKGFVRVLQGNPDTIFDVIPIDIVAHCQIVAAWCVATHRSPSMSVFNCARGDEHKITFGTFLWDSYDLAIMNPLPKAFQDMFMIMTKNKFLYRILSFYQHYIPAAVLDIYLSYKGSKLKLVKLYQFFDRMADQLYYFITTSFEFQTDNFHSLSKELQSEEKELFYTEFGEASFKEIIQTLPSGAVFFDWEGDNLSRRKRLHIVQQRTMVTNFIKRFTLLLFIVILYLIISKIFY